MKIRRRRYLPPTYPERSGLHLSSVIKYMLQTRDPERYTDEVNDRIRTRWEVGFGWEDAVALRDKDWNHPHVLVQVPYEVDGVRCTIDLLDTRPSSWIVGETKLTWISARNPIRSHRFIHWFWQTKGYAYAAQTTRVCLIVCFAMGKYDGRGPRAWCYDITYTRRELVENWQMILTYADELRAKLRKKGIHV